MFVERSVFIAAAPERVGPAVTRPADLERWYTPGCPREILELGPAARVRFHKSLEAVPVATIAVTDSGREFTLGWQAGPDADAAEIVTTFRLKAAEGGARATIYECGYDRLPGDGGLALAGQTMEDWAASLGA